MTTLTDPQEILITSKHALSVSRKGGARVFDIDTLTLAARLSGRFYVNDIRPYSGTQVNVGGSRLGIPEVAGDPSDAVNGDIWYNTVTNTLRGRQSGANENLVGGDIIGPPGPPGEEGEQGEMGPPGLAGVAGAAGTQGTAGLMGIPGADGDEGEPGLPGPPGLVGGTGVAGAAGAAGDMGPAGLGVPGFDGDDGEPGFPGLQGLTGATGAAGDPGATGAQGPVGLGVPGVDGEDGEMGFPGQGLQGSPGATGDVGPQGSPGWPGFDGEDGEPGIPGAAGAVGVVGPAGADGAAGAAGPAGLGIPSFDGEDGEMGIPGPIGPAGAAHNIFSAPHSDTTGAASPVDGDIIIANVTPKWSKLAISIPAANVRNVLGIDNAELRPSWKTALDATNPADIGAAASPGTSLVFSHRDHIHAHPDLGDLHTGYLQATGARAGSTAGAQSFGATGIMADVIAESTAAAGVTVDGLLIKDEFVEFDEIAAPGAPTANKGRLYSVDRVGLTTLAWVDSGGVLAMLSHSPAVRAYHDEAGNVPTGAWGSMLLNQEDYDTDSMHSTAANTSRLTATTAGKYRISGHVSWNGSAVGQRGIRILHNGTTNIAAVTDSGREAGNDMNVTTTYHLAAAGYVEIQLFQDTGGDLGVLAGRHAEMEWFAP